jgi:LuxR family transcriptional regulator, maltose regulon positive regulatory protein
MTLRFRQKLLVPTATRPLLERADLLVQIEQAVTARRVVALTAPAGWGKTTALAQWAAQSKLPVAWYTLDRADRDPHLFLDYVLHTIAPFVPSAQSISAQIATTSPRNISDLYQAAALEIAAAPAAFALVFDDFHTIDDELPQDVPSAPLIFELIGSIIEYAPSCHLVLASRTLPARQGLARMGVQQRATLLDYRALQFSAAEVRQLARLANSAALLDERSEQLAAQLDGWIAGIILSLDQALQSDDYVSIDNIVDKDQIYDFFAEQIIAPLDPVLQRFLEDSSVLEDLSPQRCNMLRQQNDSAQFLNEARSRGFLTARRGEWLAYHSLFRDFLRARLAQDAERELLLLRRAGDLYRVEEDIERALDCYIAAHAVDDAIALLQAAAPRLIRLSRQTVLLRCFELLGSYLTQHLQPPFLPPALLIIQARVYRDLALWDRAELALQLASTLGDAETRWEATIMQAELLNVQGNHVRSSTILDTLTPEALPPHLQFAFYKTAGRVQIRAGMIHAGIALLEHAATLGLTTFEAANDPTLLGSLADLLGWAYALAGDRVSALRHLQRADACWQASGNDGQRAMTLNNLGTLAMEEGRYAEARDALEAGLQLAQQTSRRREDTDLHITRGELHIIEGQLGQAIACFRKGYRLANQANVPLRADAAAAGALWAAALQGDITEAHIWQPIVEARQTAQQPDVEGRRTLAATTLLLRQPRPDPVTLADLGRQIETAAASLQLPERIAATLLRATLALEDGGWTVVAPFWETFAQQSAGVADALLVHFVALHRRLFALAAQKSPVARRLLAARQSNTPRQWRVQALGAFACLVDGAPCELSPLHRALLICLLDAGPRGLAVEQVWEAVWGEADLSMPALHQALYRLRAQTGLEAAAREGICKINSAWDAIDYDVRALEKILDCPVSHASAHQAMGLYQSDFLPSAPLSAAHWADIRRSFLRQRYLDMLEEYAQAIEDNALEQAIQCYQRILQIDSCREQTAVRLMHLAAHAGNHSLLTETFNHLVGALRALGLTPEPATQALLTTRARASTGERLSSV